MKLCDLTAHAGIHLFLWKNQIGFLLLKSAKTKADVKEGTMVERVLCWSTQIL